MPFVTHTASLRAPTDQVWTFVRSFDNWAHFIDGYQAHEVLTDTRSTWSIKGTAGSVTRIVTFDVEIIEWVEDDRVEFTLTGTSEPLTGKGKFLTRTTPADPVTTAAAATVHARDAHSPARKGAFARLLDKLGRWLHRKLLKNGAVPDPHGAAAALPHESVTEQPMAEQPMAGRPCTDLTFNLELSAGGMMTPMINSMMVPMLTPVAENLATELIHAIEQSRTATGHDADG